MAISSVVNVSSGQALAGNDVASAGRSAATGQASAVQTPPAQQAPKPEPAPSVKEVRDATDKINKALQTLTSSSIEFSVDHDSGRTIVRVVDVATKDVIRQIPNEETLAIAKSLDKFQGLLVRQKA